MFLKRDEKRDTMGKIRNIAVLTSGGDSPGMNAAVRSVTRCAIDKGLQVYGITSGYAGLLRNEIRPFCRRDVGGIVQKGGTFIGSARCLEFKDPSFQRKGYEILRQHEIDALVVVGGDGSMNGAWALTKLGLPTITIPGTIDNDMCGTQRTIGFDTTLNTILDAVSKIRDTIASHARVAVIEVMGRHSGQLALHAGIACGAEVVLLPEHELTMEQMCERLYETHNNGKTYSIVLVAEGAKSGYEVYKYLKENTYFDPTVTVLGYIQRGGSPSAQDNLLGAVMGEKAISALLEGHMGSVIGWIDGEIVATPYEQAVQMKYGLNENLCHLLEVLSS